MRASWPRKKLLLLVAGLLGLVTGVMLAFFFGRPDHSPGDQKRALPESVAGFKKQPQEDRGSGQVEQLVPPGRLQSSPKYEV